MNNATVPASLSIHGVQLVNLAMEEAMCAIEVALTKRQPAAIAFVNADCINIASGDARYRASLAHMDWVFVDGIGMRIAGKLLRQPVRDNVNGTDLFPQLCELLTRQGKTLYLLGGQPGVAEAAADWATQHFPGLRIAGSRHGYFAPAEEAGIALQIEASQADVVLVGLGTPHQEAWINRHMPQTGATVVMGVGGLFDYYSGRLSRAPVWMRRIGLEWLFRLCQEPRRLFKRYVIGNVVFLCRIGLDLLGQRHRCDHRR